MMKGKVLKPPLALELGLLRRGSSVAYSISDKPSIPKEAKSKVPNRVSTLSYVIPDISKSGSSDFLDNHHHTIRVN